jgi:pyruvate dehydrogenase (quinone)
MSKIVADVIVQTIQAAGVKRCYGIVGDTLNRIAYSIEQSDIDFVQMRHEEAGAFAAGAEAQLTGNLTACAGSCGPGSLHFINGLYEANRNRSPVILIASQIVSHDLGFSSVQEVDFTEVFKGCSVFCDMILTPEHAQRKTVAACQAALTKRGVAVLIVPADISASNAAHELPYSVHVSHPIIQPNDDELDKIAEILNNSKAITIFAGAGCQGAHDEVVNTAALLKAPMAHTSRGKDFVEYDNPYNVGMTGVIGGPAGFHSILDCDVLLQLGADFAWSQFYPHKAKIIQVDADPTHIGHRHPVTIGVTGNIKNTLQALLPRLKQHKDTVFLDKYVAMHEKMRKAAHAEATKPPRSPIHGSYLTHLINRYANEDALFVSDDGTALVWTLRHIDTNGKRRTFASLLQGTMATAMPSAIGLQKCQPQRQVIALCGDGGFTMLLGELLTVIQENVPIKIVIYDNERLGFVDIEQRAEGLLPLYTHLQNPDFAAIAKVVGLWGKFVSKPAELEESVKEWVSQPGPALLHVKVATMQLIMPPAIMPEAVVGMALYTAKAVLHGRGDEVWEMFKETF